jgi:DNA-directed RNA polymerase specialized sigma24 family protein
MALDWESKMENQLLDESTETDLLHRAKAGNFAAFQQLVAKLQPRVYGLTYRILQQAQDAEDATQQAEVQAELEKALLGLDDTYRLVFVVRDVEGLSVRETAQALDLTESTVKVRLLRARLALRERLTRKFGDLSQAMTPDHKHS